MRSMLHLLIQSLFLQISFRSLCNKQFLGSLESCACTWLQKHLFHIQKITHIFVKHGIIHSKFSAEQRHHHTAYESGWTSNCQSVCCGQSGQPYILYTDLVMKSGDHTKCHTRSLYRLCKEAVDRIAKYFFQTKGHTARRTSYSTGDIYKQRMILIHFDLLLFQLFCQTFGSYRIPKKKIFGIFIIYKITLRVLIRQFPSVFHSFAVIRLIFHDGHTMRPEQILLPLLGICRHMYNDCKSYCRTHNTDAHTKITS